MLRPMLAVSVKNIIKAEKELRYPFFCSSKIDGIRCLVRLEEGIPFAQTRSGLRIPNEYISSELEHPDLVGLDGEITVGDIGAHNVCAATSSAVNSFDGFSIFEYHVFDLWNHPGPTEERNRILFEKFLSLAPKFPFLRFLPQRIVNNEEERLIATSEMSISAGVILKRVDAGYKYGRATVNSQELVKDKPFIDEECVIVEVIQGTTNKNQLERSPLGFAKRSTHASNIDLVDTAGLLLCKSEKWGFINVTIGSMTHSERKWLWDNRKKVVGEIITYTYLPVGSLEKPRSPQFKFFRKGWDL